VSSAATALAIATALGCALNGGVLFAFSAFVLPALGRLAPAEGIRAMQSINVVAITPAFMTAFVGTAALCVALIAVALAAADGPAAWLVAGALTYVVGVFALTRAYNVPLNDGLARLGPAAADADAQWRRYRRLWARANHLRAAAGVAAAGLIIGGLVAA
jgi:uncharacterized membrane protein